MKRIDIDVVSNSLAFAKEALEWLEANPGKNMYKKEGDGIMPGDFIGIRDDNPGDDHPYEFPVSQTHSKTSAPRDASGWESRGVIIIRHDGQAQEPTRFYRRIK